MELNPGYKQTEVGVIPEDWELRPLLSAVKVASGQVNPRIEPYRSMILVAPDHIEGGSGRLLKKETARFQRAISGKYLFAKGDVYSKIRPYLRKAILANFEGLCSADMYPLKPTVDISAGFVFATILGHHFSKYAESVSVRSGMPKINRLELAEYVLALPPTKAEQESIAEALSDADALIESLEQLITKKRQIKQGAMQELLTGKRRLPGFSGGWEERRLEESCELVTKGTTPTSIGRDFAASGINFLKAESINERGNPIRSKVAFIDEKTNQLLKRSQLFEGDVVISIAGVLGRVGLIDRDILPANTNQALAIIRLKKESKIERNYLFYYLRSPMITKQINDINVQAAQANISLQNIRELLINLPPSPLEQTAIATILKDMDTEITALETKLAKARQVKQGMMQELLTGRIRLI